MKSKTTKNLALKSILVLSLIVAISTTAGCAGFLSQLIYIVKGNKLPADYKGLENKKIAVVCVSDASAYGTDDLAYQVCLGVNVKLAKNVKNIELIPPYKIEELIDQSRFDGSNYEVLRDEFGAEAVLAIELSNYSIHEGQTMYKGRANVTATVFNMTKDGQVDYVVGPQEYSFPENGRPAIQTNDRQFEMVYIAKLTDYITRNFYAHEKADTIAEDATYLY